MSLHRPEPEPDLRDYLDHDFEAELEQSSRRIAARERRERIRLRARATRAPSEYERLHA